MAVERRLLVVRRLLDTHEVASQEELVDLLAGEGFEVTQATVSRDLQRLGAVKIRSGGTIRYAGGGCAAARFPTAPRAAAARARRASAANRSGAGGGDQHRVTDGS